MKEELRFSIPYRIASSHHDGRPLTPVLRVRSHTKRLISNFETMSLRNYRETYTLDPRLLFSLVLMK
jgi:hypothetical protein